MNKNYDFKTLLGQGSFSTIYSGIDPKTHKKVAFKIEKPDKSKRVLLFEYQVLLKLQGLSHICKVYEFVESDQVGGLNFIIMQLLGKNLGSLKKCKGKEFTIHYAISILLQILESIEVVHDKGYIHRDIKPSNFVIGKGKKRGVVYMVDFGLAKLHLNEDGKPIEKRESADFRGTVTFASLNAHNKDLGRRDDLWSFYFMMLDFLGESLPWRSNKESKIDDVKEIKTKCFANPEKLLWRTTTKDMEEVKNIFYYIQKLKYEDRPDYEYIRQQLVSLQEKTTSSQTKTKSDLSTNKVISKRKRLKRFKEECNTKTKKLETIIQPSDNYRFLECGVFPCCENCIKQAAQLLSIPMSDKQQSSQIENYSKAPSPLPTANNTYQLYPNYSQFQTQLYQPQFSPYLQQGTQQRPQQNHYLYTQINSAPMTSQQPPYMYPFPGFFNFAGFPPFSQYQPIKPPYTKENEFADKKPE